MIDLMYIWLSFLFLCGVGAVKRRKRSQGKKWKRETRAHNQKLCQERHASNMKQKIYR